MYKDKYIKYKAKYLDIMSNIESKNLNQTGGFDEIEISSIDHEGGGFFKKMTGQKETPFIEGKEWSRTPFQIFDEHREYSAKILTGERNDKITKLHSYFTKYKEGTYSRVVQFSVCVRFADYKTSAKELLFISDPSVNLLDGDDITLTGKLYENSEPEPQEGNFTLNITEESLTYSIEGEEKYLISEKKLKNSEILVSSSASYITSIPITEKDKEAKKIKLNLNGNKITKYKFSQIGLDALSAANTELHLYSDMIVIPEK